MITLADIAREAGTSVSTVSRALKGNSRISPEMREKIEQIAERSNYNKHKFKKRNLSNNPGRIGVIVPEVMSGYYAKLVHLSNEHFSKYNYLVSVRITDFDKETMINHLREFSTMEMDGLLITLDDSEELTADICEAISHVKCPVMNIASQYIPNLDIDSIYLDEPRGIYMGIEHLVQRGYKSIGFIGDRFTWVRLKSYKESMQHFGREIREEFIAVSPLRAEAAGYNAAQQILSHGRRPDAIFAAYDQIAIGAIQAFIQAGLRIPEDIAVIGFDDIITSRYILNGLTTIQNPCEDMISISCRILMNRIREGNSAAQQQIALKPQLIIRSTT